MNLNHSCVFQITASIIFNAPINIYGGLSTIQKYEWILCILMFAIGTGDVAPFYEHIAVVREIIAKLTPKKF